MTRDLLRVSGGYVFLHTCMAGTRMAAPLLALGQGYSPAAVGVLVALFALTQVFLALPAGRFTDRHGVKRPIGLCVCASLAGGVLATLWPVFPVLCVSALLTGGATGAASIAMQRHAGRAANDPTQLKKVFSWMSIGPAVANFLGPFITGLVIDHAGFRAAFFVMAMMPLACWAWVRKLEELPPVEQAPPAASQRAWDLWMTQDLRRLLLINWFISTCWEVHSFMLPVLGHARGLSASVIGTILGLFAIAAASIRVGIPIVAAHIREWAMITAAMIATATVFAIYPLLDSPVAMAACSMLLGISLGSVQPMVMSMLYQLTPEHRRSEAIAMRVMVINASSVAMPMLFGAAGALVGVSGVFWVVGAVVGLGSRVAYSMKDAAPDDVTTDRRT